MRVIIVVVLATVCLVSADLTIKEQTGPQLQCPTPDTSTVKVVLRTQKNITGHWVSRVGIKQRMETGEGSVADLWMVDVEQNTEACEDDASVLETVFYLSAPSSTRGKPATPIDSESPRCPSPTTCPSTTPATPIVSDCPRCPTPTTCPTTTPTTPTTKSIPPGYQHFVGVGFYRVPPQAETWLDAKHKCEAEGAHLLILNSDKEADVIKTLMSHYPSIAGAKWNGLTYLGAQRIGKTYYTVLGGELGKTGYERWRSGKPDGGADEICLFMEPHTSLLDDIQCYHKLPYVCERLSTGTA